MESWLDTRTFVSRCCNARAATMTPSGVQTGSMSHNGMLTCAPRPKLVADLIRLA